MEDIAPALYEKLRRAFEKRIEKSPALAEAMRKIAEGNATHKDSYKAAEVIGEALAAVFRSEISPAELPDGRMYWNIGKKVVEPLLKASFEQVGEVAAGVQESLNRSAGLGLKAVKPTLKQELINGILNRLDAEDFTSVRWILDAPVVNFAMHTVDETIEANANFHGSSGLRPKVTRISVGGCCDWCEEVAGVYYYPDVPKDVWRRHDRCKCIVTYDPGDGKLMNVHTKSLLSTEEKRIMEERRTVGISSDSIEPRIREIAIAAQEGSDAKIPVYLEGNFDDFAELTINDTETKALKALKALSDNSGCEYGQIISDRENTEPFTNGKRDRIAFDLSKVKGDELKLYHSHTNDTPFSVEDYAKLLEPRITEIGVITRNGDIFTARIGGGIMPTEEEFRRTVKRIRDEVDAEIRFQSGFSEMSYGERNYCAIREQAYRIAREFEWELEGGKSDG